MPKHAYSHTKTYNENGEKWCCNCKEYHHINMFAFNKRSNDGRDWRCAFSRSKQRTKERIEHKKIIPAFKATNEIENELLKYPTLESQMNYKYIMPDYYELYINKNKQL